MLLSIFYISGIHISVVVITTSLHLQDYKSPDAESLHMNGILSEADDQPGQSPDLLGDLLSPLAIEGPPTSSTHEQSTSPVVEGVSGLGDASAIVPVDEPTSSVQVPI